MFLPGFCKVDETPKGWYVQYIDRDPETIRLQEEQARRKKADLDDEERSAKFINEQVRRGRDGKEIEVSADGTGFSCECVNKDHIYLIFCSSAGNSRLHRAETRKRGRKKYVNKTARSQTNTNIFCFKVKSKCFWDVILNMSC